MKTMSISLGGFGKSAELNFYAVNVKSINPFKYLNYIFVLHALMFILTALVKILLLLYIYLFKYNNNYIHINYKYYYYVYLFKYNNY